MSKLAVKTDDIITQLIGYYNTVEVTTQNVREWAIDVGYKPSTILNRLSDYKSGRGKFNLDKAKAVAVLEETFNLPTADSVPSCVTTEQCPTQSLVPDKDNKFVEFGNFKDVKSIIKSGIFFPVFITGLSGNGKTLSVEQSCAQLGRDLVRVNITVETDTDDLIGGFRLINGETVWHNGPVIEAMERGAVLLLDEVDLASTKIMCLQSVLEGKGYYIKKTNRWVKPADGFNIVATANTKGRSDDTGKFIGTNVLNEAFLERFAVTFEQQYPTPSVESKILTRLFVSLNVKEFDTIVQNLTSWADIIRKTYQDGGIDDCVSTRRLTTIVKSYAIWNDMTKAITLCTNRFDDDTKKVFLDLYQKVSGDSPLDSVSDVAQVVDK